MYYQNYEILFSLVFICPYYPRTFFYNLVQQVIFCAIYKKVRSCASLYEGVIIVPTALYGAEAWGMRSAERRKVNVLEMKCLRSFGWSVAKR